MIQALALNKKRRFIQLSRRGLKMKQFDVHIDVHICSGVCCFLSDLFIPHKKLLYSSRHDKSTEDESAPVLFCRVSKFETHLYLRGLSLILAFLYNMLLNK